MDEATKDSTRENMFWVLQRPNDTSGHLVYATLLAVDETPIWRTAKCPACGRSRIIEQLSDLNVELHGETLGDFVWSDGPEILVKEALMYSLKKSTLKDFTFRAVKVLAWWREMRRVIANC